MTPPHKDIYDSFGALAQVAVRERDYRTVIRPASTEWAVIAPHGGGIEPGTSELARAVAADRWSLYLFEGLRTRNNNDLHITGTHFDEPGGIRLVRLCTRALALHGCAGRRSVISVGGLDAATAGRMLEAFHREGIAAVHAAGDDHAGTHPANVCNRCTGGRGVQLELSRGLRAAMFTDLTRTGRQTTTRLFHTIVECIKSALEIRNPASSD